MVAGAAWAGIAGVLGSPAASARSSRRSCSTRSRCRWSPTCSASYGDQAGDSRRHHRRSPEGSRARRLHAVPRPPTEHLRLALLAVVAGVAFSFCSTAPGSASTCAPPGSPRPRRSPSGVNVKRMVVFSMLLSGAVAGLIGMPELFGASHTYGSTIQTGIGFAGIAVALLGRNHPLGHRLRRADLRLPQRAGQPARHPGRHLARTSSGHPGRRRARGGHRLRGRAPLPGRGRAGRGQRQLEAAKRHDRRGGAGMSVVWPQPRRRRRPTTGSRAAATWRAGSRSACWSRMLRWPGSSPAPTTSPRPGTLRAASIAAIPIALAGLGGLWSERAGVVNIGLEGMMILGTLGAGYFAYYYGVWVGLARRRAVRRHRRRAARDGHGRSSASTTSCPAWRSTSSRRAPRGFLAEAFFADLEGGGADPVAVARPAARHHRARASRTSPNTWPTRAGSWSPTSPSLVGALTDQTSRADRARLRAGRGTAWLLWQTAFGLRLRSCGESPAAAETLGVNVYRYKFIAVNDVRRLRRLRRLLPGHGGVRGLRHERQTDGRGYIGLAAMIFGNWRPGGLLTGSLLFGYTEAAGCARRRVGARAAAARRDRPASALAVWQFYRGSAPRRVVFAVARRRCSCVVPRPPTRSPATSPG